LRGGCVWLATHRRAKACPGSPSGPTSVTPLGATSFLNSLSRWCFSQLRPGSPEETPDPTRGRASSAFLRRLPLVASPWMFLRPEGPVECALVVGVGELGSLDFDGQAGTTSGLVFSGENPAPASVVAGDGGALGRRSPPWRHRCGGSPPMLVSGLLVWSALFVLRLRLGGARPCGSAWTSERRLRIIASAVPR
jgi:hypothetical protein